MESPRTQTASGSLRLGGRIGLNAKAQRTRRKTPINASRASVTGWRRVPGNLPLNLFGVSVHQNGLTTTDRGINATNQFIDGGALKE